MFEMAAPSEPFIPNEHQVFVGKIFAVLGALFGVAVFISIKILVRRWMKRRASAAVANPSEEPKIRLWTIHFPELQHLPPDERETLLRTALEGSEIQIFRRRVRICMKVLSALITATILAIVLVDQAKHLFLLPICVIGALVTIIGAAFARVQIGQEFFAAW